jgi:sarcosine oxidase delta subunit
LSTGIDFNGPASSNVPEFSFVLVTEDEVCNAVMFIKSNAAGVDADVFNHIITCSEFSAKRRAFVVLLIPKVAVSVKFI